ncbi:MAG: hypothetical protein ACXV78_01150, partial [Candidatus Angelobacter sp.]
PFKVRAHIVSSKSWDNVTMSYQKPVNSQRFDRPVYEQQSPKKKTEKGRPPGKKQTKQRTSEAPSGRKTSGGTKVRSRTNAKGKSK